MAHLSQPAPESTAALLAGYLHAAGVRHVFGYPGESIIDFMEAARHRGIQVVSAVREGTAAFMAEAAAMTSGRLGVCLSTLGPGSTAVLNGVASATLDRVPVLAISGQIESSREQFFTHQVVDHDRMFAPVSKLALRLDPASADTVIRKALRTAVAERPGAVHLTVTADAWPVAAEGQVSLPPLAPAAGSVDVYGNGDPVELISPWSVATPVLHLDTTPNTDQVYASALELVGHVGAILGWLSAQWAGEPRWAESDVAAHRARLHAAWLAGRAEGRLNPSDVVAIAREAAPPGTILTTDVGSHQIMAGPARAAPPPRSGRRPPPPPALR